MRVLLIDHGDYPFEVRIQKMCCTLVAAGHEVHLLCGNRGARPRAEIIECFRVHRMPALRGALASANSIISLPAFFNPMWLWLLHRVSALVRPDVIIARDLPMALVASIYRAVRKVPVIFDFAENYPAALAVSEMVEFMGRAPYDDLPRLLAECDIGVVPHLANELVRTTLPNKLFECMAVGLPVIVSDVPPMARIVGQAGCGLVFTAGNAHSLAGAVQRLADPDLRLRMGALARQAVLERYNWPLDGQRLVRVIESASCQPSRGHSLPAHAQERAAIVENYPWPLDARRLVRVIEPALCWPSRSHSRAARSQERGAIVENYPCTKNTAGQSRRSDRLVTEAAPSGLEGLGTYR